MAFFTEEYIRFFQELEHNNNTEWFEANRQRYENAVRIPFATLTGEMIKRIERYEPTLGIAPSEAIFRIDGDDDPAHKSAAGYNIYMSANISPEGRRFKSQPGFYYRFGAHEALVAGGVYALEPEDMARVRSLIAWHGDEFRQLLEAPEFKSKFGDLRTDKRKSLPSDLKALSPDQAFADNEHFYYLAHIPIELVMHNSLPDVLMEFYKAGKPLNEFLRRALQVEQ